jgi:hypothetical protein
MFPWYTGRPWEYTKKSHVNRCVFDSTWEASEAAVLDRDERVVACLKNDHLGFEIVYVFDGQVRKYRPDYLVRLTKVCPERGTSLSQRSLTAWMALGERCTGDLSSKRGLRRPWTWGCATRSSPPC